MHWLYGVNRAFWDVWDNGNNGTLYHNYLLPGGVSYTYLSKWLVGASMDKCIHYSNATWACHLARANGYQAWVLWNTNGSTTYHLNSALNLKVERTLTGGKWAISPSSYISIGTVPVMVETWSVF